MVNTRFLTQQGDPLEGDLPLWLQDTLASILEFLPRLAAALIILIIGWIAGRIIGGIIRRIVDRAEVDRRLMDTPMGEMLGGTESSVAGFFGKLAKWFIYVLAIIAAADVLAIALLSQWLTAVVSYLPVFIGGLLVIVLGFIVADFIGDMIARTEAATKTRYTKYFAEGTKILLYLLAIVIGLDTMGIDLTGLYVLIRPLLWGLAVGIALAIGIGVGWGFKDYIAENMERWSRRARDKVRRE